MATYKGLKKAIIDVVDDFTKEDVVANYGASGSRRYSAKTKLETLKINGAMKASMTHRFNKVVREQCGPTSQSVGDLHMVELKTIADAIKLACRAGQVAVPTSLGEPT